MTKGKQIPVLHPLRAIASLAVCLFHFICTVQGLVYSETIRTIFSVGHYGVQIFFVISGFIIPWSMYHSFYKIKDYFTFILKRFIRLEPPYILSLILAIATTYVRKFSPHFNNIDTTPTLKQIALHFGYLIPFFEGEKWIRTIYWTLAIEFQYYISMGLLFCWLSSNKIGRRVVAYLVILLGPVIMNDFLPYHFPVFLLGISIFLYKSNIIKKIEFIIISILTACIVFVFHGSGTLIASAIPYLSILFFTNFNNKLLHFFGEISYSVYLFHSVTGLVVINYFSHTVQNTLSKVLLLILALTVSIIFSYLVFRFVELPSKKLSSKIKFKNSK